MGSGPSKENEIPQRAEHVSKTSRQLDLKSGKDSAINGQKQGKQAETVNTGNIKNNNQTQGTGKQDAVKPPTKTVSSDKNGNVTKPDVKKLGKFESDSESDGEDISAVLEATRNEYNSKLQTRDTVNRDSSLPETYAQRLQREQYRHQPQGILRQKTIYRNPDEWEIDENEESFDVSKFKQVNIQDKHHEQKTLLEKDIFSPNIHETKSYDRKMPEPDGSLLIERKKSLPHYDTSEEALLAEIEKEFEL